MWHSWSGLFVPFVPVSLPSVFGFHTCTPCKSRYACSSFLCHSFSWNHSTTSLASLCHITEASTIEVNQPSSSEAWMNGREYIIKWTTRNIGTYPHRCAHVTVRQKHVLQLMCHITRTEYSAFFSGRSSIWLCVHGLCYSHRIFACFLHVPAPSCVASALISLTRRRTKSTRRCAAPVMIPAHMHGRPTQTVSHVLILLRANSVIVSNRPFQ